ncbi:flagellar protein FliS [Anoxynatronum buryatiense]|uniref:Flagellar protein FliS n=1 Tax=Anoxynatronum buryatiense TaxID=489973 RepID=A0AA46AK84_9CLOT|nr:flagellar export chaperone FliS [Anoxynatronum buryatiense]SMP67307.1 flagellar protein FliS [Anoxynatronum buryatiense]
MTEQEKLEQQVAQASDAELVVLLLEGINTRLDEGIGAVTSGDHELLETAVAKIRAILGELLATLWGDSEVAIQSRQIYLYMNKLVTDAGNRRANEPLEEAKKVLKPLLDGWQHLVKHPELAEAPTSTQGPSVVAGMTYGKGTLNESVMNSGDRLGKG